MKYEQGNLTEEDLKIRRRFWNKKGFFGEPTKEAIEKRSNNTQELLSAIKDMTYEEITAIRHARWLSPSNKNQRIVWRADKEDLEYALMMAPKTFKVNQSNNI